MRRALNLKQVQSFVAVAEEMSFRRAAQRLCITQPPLSRQVRALQEQLGVALFERAGRGIVLTEAGLEFLGRARVLLQDAQRLVGDVRREPQAQQSFTVGITTVVDAGLFSWIESEFARLFPAIRLKIKRQISIQSVRDLNQGVLDAAVIGLPVHTEGLEVEPLRSEPMLVGLSSQHGLARKRRLALQDLAQEPLFWFDRKRNPAYYAHCERVFERHGFAPARVPEPSDYHVLLSLLAQGQGVALIPESLRAIERKGIAYRPLLQGQELAIGMGVARPIGDRSETTAGFCALVKQRLAPQPAGG